MNLLNGLQRGSLIIGALNGLVPVLGALINSAESLFPNPGSGVQKLTYVQGVIKDVLTFGGNAIADVEQILPAITSVINNIVAAAKGPLPSNPIPPPTSAP